MDSSLLLCLSVVILCAALAASYFTLSFFIRSLDSKISTPYLFNNKKLAFILHSIASVCIFIFAISLSSLALKNGISLDSIDFIGSMLFSTCLFLLYISSVIDFLFLCIPSMLLSMLFFSAVAIYIYYFGFSLYPFAILGIFYGIHFSIHSLSSRELIGEGDIWIISSIFIVLDSLFDNDVVIAYFFIIASLFGILYIAFLYAIKRDLDSKIPFAPFLSFGFIAASVIHAI